jgi:hypothetical protein
MKERRSGLNEEDAQRLMAWHFGGKRPRTKRSKERTMGQIFTKREQAFVTAFGMQIFLIIRVVIIGWKQGVLAGTNRMMDRVVSPAAAYAGKNPVTFPVASILRVRARKRSLKAAQTRQKQTGENSTNRDRIDQR